MLDSTVKIENTCYNAIAVSMIRSHPLINKFLAVRSAIGSVGLKGRRIGDMDNSCACTST